MNKKEIEAYQKEYFKKDKDKIKERLKRYVDKVKKSKEILIHYLD